MKIENYSLWVKIIKFFAPYYEPKPKKKKKKVEKKPKKLNNKSKQVEEVEEVEEVEKVETNETEVEEQAEEVETNEIKDENNDQQGDNNLNQVKSNHKDAQTKNKTNQSTASKQSNYKKSSLRDEFDKKVMDELDNKTPNISLAGEQMLMPILNYPKPLDDAINLKTKPKLNKIWFYHDAERHQVFGHFSPGSGMMCKTRNDELRGQTQMWVKPMKMKYDRTHLIPIGYHGSDGDPRIMVGWDPSHNQNELKNFEFKQKKRKEEIYWLTDVRKTKYGATWTYKIYSAKSLKLLEHLTLKMDKRKFMWRK